MMQKIIFIIAISLSLMLSGCQSSGKETGSVIGAVIGGIIGSQFGSRYSNEKTAAMIAGTLLGSWIGGEIGREMSEGDFLKAQSAEEEALESDIGDKIDWSNEETGNYGSVTPVREGRNDTGNQCREFQHNVIIEGKEEIAYGTACKDSDGKWQIIEESEVF